MLSAAPLVLPDEARDEAKAYLRIVGEDENALVERLMWSAAELCERFTGQALVARSFGEVLPTGGAWTRLGAAPVRAISAVDALAPDGTATIRDKGERPVRLRSLLAEAETRPSEVTPSAE